jgi:predicted nucleic acid-binding protein
LDEDEATHLRARATWADLLDRGISPVTSNYVLVETAAVIQRRLGLQALRKFLDGLAPVLDVVWVSEAQHRLGMNAALIADRRKLSVVDCISFLIMRERRVATAFTFDEHFREQGFKVVP